MEDPSSGDTVGNKRWSLSSGELVAWRIFSAIQNYIVSENKDGRNTYRKEYIP